MSFLIGRELCFWCVEGRFEFKKKCYQANSVIIFQAHQPCEKHGHTREVYTEDVSIRAFLSEDRFEIVEEKNIVNFCRFVKYSEGNFWLPPTRSTAIVSSFEFKSNLPPPLPFSIPIQSSISTMSLASSSSSFSSSSFHSQNSKIIVEDKKPKKQMKQTKPSYQRRHFKLHQNTIKTAPKKNWRGRKVELEMKQHVCDICEESFTMRQNMQQHLVNFHGARLGLTQKIVAKMEKLRESQYKIVKEKL
ncbi:unnamed protein product [Caenorhabditis angaria]|uniref:C2H2-type domain-containing protein n=1 Tax=Caenorhabditis angaria TaxID=860376 RepID=A0A9P1MZA6_9PELO|nr:unnamed protein product [Caenorhabditis angaria]